MAQEVTTEEPSSPPHLSRRRRASLWSGQVGGDTYRVGDDVWITRDDELMFELAKVVSLPQASRNDGHPEVRVMPRSTSSSAARERMVPVSQLYRADGGSIDVETVNDISQLPLVNEPIVNDVIRRRYLSDSIYTAARPMLIAVNPFRDLDNTTADIATYYRNMVPDDRRIDEAAPHIFRIAAQALTAHYIGAGLVEEATHDDDNLIMSGGRGSSVASAYQSGVTPDAAELNLVNGVVEAAEGNVSILISGESGAGKTETCKHLMKFFTEPGTTTATADDEDSSSLCNALMAFNPILEAFGNAKTSRNDNSSRFGNGKLVKLYLSRPSSSCAAADDLRHHPTVAGGQVLSFLLEKSRICLHEEGERNYHIFYQLLRGGSPELLGPGGLGLDPQKESYKVLNGLLPSIAGVDDGKDYQVTMNAMITLGIENTQRFDICRVLAAILHIGQIEWQQHHHEGSNVDESRDNLAAEVVNYAPVEPLLRVLQAPNYGCISHIESACLLQTGTDQSIMNAFTKAGYPLDLLTTGMIHQQRQKASSSSSSSKGMARKDNPADIFIIHHTAGSVTYNINGFRDKNMDRLSDDLYALISHTSNDVLKEAVAVASPSSEGAPQQQQQGGGARRSAYIAQKFVHSIDSLMAMLDPTEAFFVRCVKPNTQKKPRLYNSRNVVRQLHSLSVFHAIKMSSCGYCFRLPFRQFIHRYHPLRFLKDTSTATAAGANDDALLMAIGDGHGEEGQEECSHLLKRFLGDDYMKGAVLGKTMVLARKECHMVLEKSLTWVLSGILGPIATTIRKTLDHKRALEKFIIRSSRLVTIQSMLRSYLIRRTEMQRIQYRRSLITVALLQRKVYMFLVARAAAMQLQTASRNLLGMLVYERRRKNLEVMNASSVLQSYGRAALSRVRYECRKESRIKDRAARLIQGAMRKAYTRRSYAKNWVWRMLVWPMKRHYQVKVDAALFIQSAWRAHVVRRQNPHVLKMIQVARERVWRRVMVEQAKGLLTAVIQGFILRATMGRYTQAAIVIQTRMRGILRPRWMRLQLSSAIKIQSLWRAYVVRVRVAMAKARIVIVALDGCNRRRRRAMHHLWLTTLLQQYRDSSHSGLSIVHPEGGVSQQLIEGYVHTYRHYGPIMDFTEFQDGTRRSLAVVCRRASPCVVVWGSEPIGMSSSLPQVLPLPSCPKLHFTSVDTISCGVDHALLLVKYNNTSVIVALGSNTRGQCGVPKDRPELPTPEIILQPPEDGSRITSVAAGPFHSLCTLSSSSNDGTMVWGAADGISLPYHFPQDVFTPTPMPTTLRFNKVYANTCGNLAITSDGTLAAWSVNPKLGVMLGHMAGDDGNFSSPKVVSALSSPIAGVSTDGRRIIVLTSDGVLYYWGCIRSTCIPDNLSTAAPGIISGRGASAYECRVLQPLRVNIPYYTAPVAEVHLCDHCYGDRVVIRLVDGTLLGWDNMTMRYDTLHPGLFQYRHAHRAEAVRVVPSGKVLGVLPPHAGVAHHIQGVKKALSRIEPGTMDRNLRILPIKRGGVCNAPAVSRAPGPDRRSSLVIRDRVGGRVPPRDSRSKPPPDPPYPSIGHPQRTSSRHHKVPMMVLMQKAFGLGMIGYFIWKSWESPA
ncbi:Unconventional myosin-Ig [Perkinsus olseni]|uniref:Unconventional myosin-Ig n=1 Tax=Perkinsus olseni TaxID=32597 RepID=A0A7J6LPS6_PEROL|nr:Unconventional myosin-Ig [Perkinsus olseni]